VYVLSDKANALFEYDVADLKASKDPSHPAVGDARKIVFKDVKPDKLEAMTPLPDGRFLASTARFLARDASRDRNFLFILSVEDGGLSANSITVPPELGDVVLERFAGGRQFAQVEGIAVGMKQPNTESYSIMIGIRQFYDRTVDKGNVKSYIYNVKYVTLVVRATVDLKTMSINKEPFDCFDFTEEGVPQEDKPTVPVMGLSDIQRDEDGSYLVLTSREAPYPDEDGKTRPPRLTDHSGALYRVPGWVLEGPECHGSFHLGRPIRTFVAKSEGIAVVEENRQRSYVVVFDDDREWKDLFHMDHNYGMYECFKSDVAISQASTVVPPVATASGAEKRFVKLKEDCRNAEQQNDEQKRKSREELKKFVQGMPKGGLLHAHMTGEYGADDQIRFAEQNGFYIRHKQDHIDELSLTGGVKLERDAPFKIIASEQYCKLDAKSRSYFKPLKDVLMDKNSPRSPHELLTFQDYEPPKEFFYAIFDRKDDIEEYPGATNVLLTEVLKKYVEENIGYVELRINPLYKGKTGNPMVDGREYVESLHEIVEEFNRNLRKQGRPDDVVEVRFVVQVFRDITNWYRSPATLDHEIFQAFALAASDDEDDDLIVGVDLIGSEHETRESGTPTDFLSPLVAAKRRFPGVHLTLHAGESNDRTMNVRDSILLGAERIGHGLNLMDDQFRTIDLAKQRSVLVEICLHCNRFLFHRPIKDHPFWTYLKKGMLLSLNTDNRGIFETDLSDEFVDAILAFDLPWSQVKSLCQNSIAYGFMSKDDRSLIMYRWQERWSKFESNP
jgi:adenosine deaminase CECR1